VAFQKAALVSIRASLQQRGERLVTSIESEESSFNPRLTSAARRTSEGNSLRGGNEVSIRASLQQRGERRLPTFDATNRAVSIRASLQQRGELRTRRQIVPYRICFNPCLTSAARRTYYGGAE